MTGPGRTDVVLSTSRGGVIAPGARWNRHPRPIRIERRDVLAPEASPAPALGVAFGICERVGQFAQVAVVQQRVELETPGQE
jgi:hypothetical protein